MQITLKEVASSEVCGEQGQYLVQFIQQLFLLRWGLGDAWQRLNLRSYQLQVVLLLCCQALDGNLGFDDSGSRCAHRRRSKLVLCRWCGRRLGWLWHRRHVLLIRGRLRGRSRLRLKLRLKLNLNVCLLGLRLALWSWLGGLCYLVMDNEKRRMRWGCAWAGGRLRLWLRLRGRMRLLLLVWRLDLLAQSERGVGRLGADRHWGRCRMSGQGRWGGHALDLQGLFVSTGGYLKKGNHITLKSHWNPDLIQECNNILIHKEIRTSSTKNIHSKICMHTVYSKYDSCTRFEIWQKLLLGLGDKAVSDNNQYITIGTIFWWSLKEQFTPMLI